MMQLPQFNECNHTIVKSLFHHSDRQLLILFQLHPEGSVLHGNFLSLLSDCLYID